MDVIAVARRERMGDRLQEHFSDVFSWIEVVSGVIIGGLVVAGVLPAWAILVVLLITVRPLWRLVIRIFAASASEP